MIEILFFITVGLWITYTAKIDSEHFNKHEYIVHHRSRFLARVLTGGLVGLFSPVGGLVLGLLFWALFDTILNRLRGLPWLYVGTVANTDKFFKNQYKLLFISKVISLITSLILLSVHGL